MREIHWAGSEDDEHRERMKACRARRKQYGQGCCPEKDGSCPECEHDMAIALQVRKPSQRNPVMTQREEELIKAALDMAATLIEENIIQDTSAGKVLRPRQEGNQDGLHYAAEIRALVSTPKPEATEGGAHVSDEQIRTYKAAYNRYFDDVLKGLIVPSGDISFEATRFALAALTNAKEGSDAL